MNEDAAAAAQAQPPPPSLAKTLALAGTIPSAPQLLPRLLDLLVGEHTDVRDLEEITRRDPGLTTSILRLANSPFFSRSAAKCETITEACLRLGSREIYRLASSAMLTRWFTQPVRGYGWKPGDLCRHSVAVAVASELLAEETRWATPEVAYTAGLTHDVGKLALAFACADRFEQVRRRQAATGVGWRRAERDVLGYDHTDVGARLLQSWSFPAVFVEVVSHYAHPTRATPTHRRVVALVHAAKYLTVGLLGPGVGEAGFSRELDEPTLAELGLLTTPSRLEGKLVERWESREHLLGAEESNPSS